MVLHNTSLHPSPFQKPTEVIPTSTMWVLLLIFVAPIASILHGQTSDRPASKTASTGRVVNEEGNPIAGAKLNREIFLTWGYSPMRTLPNVTTDEQGVWEWDHAEWPDIHSARIVAKGYKSESISFTLPGHFETVLKRPDVISIVGHVVA